MSDIDTALESEGDTPNTKLSLKISKGKAGYVEIDTASITDMDTYTEALRLGLEVLVNRGMSKETKASHGGDEAKLAASCMKIAEANLKNILEGKIKYATKKATAKDGITRDVVNEARRLAKAIVKDQLKAQGFKLAHVGAPAITAAANEYLEADPSLYDQAKKNLEERSKAIVKIDLKSKIKVDPKLVAKEAAKRSKGKSLSSTQAGKVAPRAKPKGESRPTAH